MNVEFFQDCLRTIKQHIIASVSEFPAFELYTDGSGRIAIERYEFNENGLVVIVDETLFDWRRLSEFDNAYTRFISEPYKQNRERCRFYNFAHDVS